MTNPAPILFCDDERGTGFSIDKNTEGRQRVMVHYCVEGSDVQVMVVGLAGHGRCGLTLQQAHQMLRQLKMGKTFEATQAPKHRMPSGMTLRETNARMLIDWDQRGQLRFEVAEQDEGVLEHVNGELTHVTSGQWQRPGKLIISQKASKGFIETLEKFLATVPAMLTVERARLVRLFEQEKEFQEKFGELSGKPLDPFIAAHPNLLADFDALIAEGRYIQAVKLELFTRVAWEKENPHPIQKLGPISDEMKARLKELWEKA